MVSFFHLRITMTSSAMINAAPDRCHVVRVAFAAVSLLNFYQRERKNHRKPFFQAVFGGFSTGTP